MKVMLRTEPLAMTGLLYIFASSFSMHIPVIPSLKVFVCTVTSVGECILYHVWHHESICASVTFYTAILLNIILAKLIKICT